MTIRHRFSFLIAALIVIGWLPWVPRTDGGEIHEAIRIDDLNAVKALLTKDPQLVQSRGDNDRTPLHEAAKSGSSEIVRFLIAKGADVTARDREGFNPLHLAGDVEIARVLIEAGADPKAKSKNGTPLEIAAQDHNVELVTLLLKSGGTLKFEELVKLGQTAEVAKMLDDNPSLARAPQGCLETAAAWGHLEIVKLLLTNGADPSFGIPVINAHGRYTPLTSAVVSGNYEVAVVLCKAGAATDVSGGKHYGNLLHEVVAVRKIRFLKLMLEHGADPNAWTGLISAGMTPLHVAAIIGDVEKCKLLIQHKADVNALTSDGATPLDFAAFANHQVVCDLLLNHGATLNIHSASALGKLSEVEKMLAVSRDLANSQDQRLCRRPLFWAAAHGHVEVVEHLIRSGAGVNVRAPNYCQLNDPTTGPMLVGSSRTRRNKVSGETPLHVAAAAGHTAVIQALLKNRARIDATDESFETPLSSAVTRGQVDAVKLLLENGAKTDDGNGDSCLLSAYDNAEIAERILEHHPSQSSIDRTFEIAAGRNRKVAELLLAHGAKADIFAASILGLNDHIADLIKADPSLANAEQGVYPGFRPLRFAAEHGHAKTVALLLENGARIHPDQTTSALHEAAGKGHIEVMKVLLGHGADINRKDSSGVTPLESAARGGHAESVEWLILHGADVRARDDHGSTVLHAAAGSGSVEAVRILIKAGLPIDCRDKSRETPLHNAARIGRAETAEYLLRAGADANAKTRRGDMPLDLVEAEDDLLDQLFDFLYPGHLGRDREAVAKLLRAHTGAK